MAAREKEEIKKMAQSRKGKVWKSGAFEQDAFPACARVS
jgi:hypothetical protein